MILSAYKSFYDEMKMLELQGILRKNIIDGRVFRIYELDFPRLLNEGVAHGALTKYDSSGWFAFYDTSRMIYPRIYVGKYKEHEITLKLGRNSYVHSLGDRTKIEAWLHSEISIGDFTAISWNITFELGLNGPHTSDFISQTPTIYSWNKPEEFSRECDGCKINIGSDVWIGRGCTFKSTNPDKPLIIGDGAMVASDSVVVKNVPPYAIVGGNPAKIIKYRFPEKIIDALLRIKWWEWDLDKIHDNFKYFNDIEKFVELHDKGV